MYLFYFKELQISYMYFIFTATHECDIENNNTAFKKCPRYIIQTTST